MIKKYRKKPVVIEAVQLKHTMASVQECMKFIGEFSGTTCQKAEDAWYEYISDVLQRDGIIIQTLEGEHLASWGDYIIKGVKGECYPCNPEIFKLTYEEVE